MGHIKDIFERIKTRPKTVDGVFSNAEVRLANRNSGNLLETLKLDITPTGLHYLLIHFDVPLLDDSKHTLSFGNGFESPYSLTMQEIKQLPSIDMPVTLECAGNGRTEMSPRTHSMPWQYEAVGTSVWTGTPLAPLIEKAQPASGTVEVSFTGADRGYDKGVQHAFGRSLTLEQIESLDVLLVYGMNGHPLLPQHGAPLRLIVPGWYGMASVKWLSNIEALPEPYQGFQQVRTYRYREKADDPGTPVTAIRVKSLMTPPGIPDWISRSRQLESGVHTITGRAWSGNGTPITRVEFSDGSGWVDAKLQQNKQDRYAWSKWSVDWHAAPGEYELSCRATDANGDIQPLDERWDASGFGNNVVQTVPVYVTESS